MIFHPSSGLGDSASPHPVRRPPPASCLHSSSSSSLLQDFVHPLCFFCLKIISTIPLSPHSERIVRVSLIQHGRIHSCADFRHHLRDHQQVPYLIDTLHAFPRGFLTDCFTGTPTCSRWEWVPLDSFGMTDPSFATSTAPGTSGASTLG